MGTGLDPRPGRRKASPPALDPSCTAWLRGRMLAFAVPLLLAAQAPPAAPAVDEPTVEEAPEAEAPRDAEAWTAQGQAAIDAEDWPAAAKAFGKARALRPEDAELMYRHAYALRQAGQRPTAVEAYRAHLERVPDNADAWYALASTLESLDRTEEAKKAFARYAEVEDRPQNQKFVELARRKAGVSSAPMSSAEAESAPISAPPPPAALKPALDALQAGDYRRALDLVPRDVTDASSEAARASALLGLGRAQESEAAWRRSLEGLKGPAALAARFGLAEALRAQGKLRDAKSLHAQVADDPTSPPVLIELATQRR